jgi:hypothetical protein
MRRLSMRRLTSLLATSALLATVLVPSFAGAAAAATCSAPTSFRGLTAAVINPSGTYSDTLDATGCDIGVYYGPGHTGTVSGATISNAHYFGVVNDGGKVTVQNSTFTTIGNMPTNGGDAILFADDNGTSTGAIKSNTITHYQKGGIVVRGASASATITGNAVTGDRQNYIAQNGIEVLYGATATVTGNFVSDNAYSGSENTSATGILVLGGSAFGTPNTVGVVISKNTLTNNDVGVWLFNAADCPLSGCVAPTTNTNNTVKINTISNGFVFNTTGFSVSPDCGYQAGISDLGHKDVFVNNKISGTGYTPQAGGDCTGTPPAFLRFIDADASAYVSPSNK